MREETMAGNQGAGTEQHKSLPRFARTSDFARSLRRHLADYRGKVGGNRFAGLSIWLKTGAAVAVGAGAYMALLAGGTTLGNWTAAGLLGLASVAAFFLLVFMGHDAAHGAISRHRRVNDALVFGIFALHGVSGKLWADRHVRLHHALPNVSGTGIDADSSNVVRLQPQRPSRWHHRLQILVGPFIYALGQAHLVWVEDFADFRERRREDPKHFGGFRPLLAFAASKLLHLTIFTGLPAVIGGFHFWQLLLGYLTATAIVSLCFAILVIGTHVSDRAVFPAPNKQNRLGFDWATLQLVTSVDWAPRSRFFAALTGGANAHTAHHLFPGYAHSHATNLARIVIAAARESGLNYRSTSFFGMVGAHLRHLQDMARPARAAS